MSEKPKEIHDFAIASEHSLESNLGLKAKEFATWGLERDRQCYTLEAKLTKAEAERDTARHRVIVVINQYENATVANCTFAAEAAGYRKELEKVCPKYMGCCPVCHQYLKGSEAHTKKCVLANPSEAIQRIEKVMEAAAHIVKLYTQEKPAHKETYYFGIEALAKALKDVT